MSDQLNSVNVIFACNGISQSMLTAEVQDFSIMRESEIKEAVGADFKFLAVATGKRKKVAKLSCLALTSGSAVTLPNILDTATLANPYSADVSGSWAVTGNPTLTFKNDDFCKFDVEVTQWVTKTGTLP